MSQPNKDFDKFVEKVKGLEQQRDEYARWGFRYILLAVGVFVAGLVMVVNDNNAGWLLYAAAFLTFVYGDSQMRNAHRYERLILSEFDKQLKKSIEGLFSDLKKIGEEAKADAKK